jgi:hypothetical protein
MKDNFSKFNEYGDEALRTGLGWKGKNAKDSDENVVRELEVVPVSIVRDLEEDEFSGSVRVHGLWIAMEKIR